MSLYNALIRTHHITGRKKLARVKVVGDQLGLNFLLVHKSCSPGLFYAESPDERSLTEWVSAVQDQHYKYYKCLRKPGLVSERIKESLLLGDREPVSARILQHWRPDFEIPGHGVPEEDISDDDTLDKEESEGSDENYIIAKSLSTYGKLLRRRGLRKWWIQAMGWQNWGTGTLATAGKNKNKQ